MIKSTEFYITPKGDVMIETQSGIKKLEFSDRDFINKLYNQFNELYPAAMEALSQEFVKFRSIPAMHEFMIVRRMIKCNFGKYDSVMDIDHLGNLNFEEVDCPLRGECHLENVVCKPKLNSKLSERELQIMQLLYEGYPKKDVAAACAVSIETVRTHKRNAFRKLGVHSLAEFNSYANQKNLFEN
ncbi:helix-turn-helix transcriptional regulator [Mangrovibacterium sp.]|uniref:helix-turn-helix domain-containing protein n=1 Tax=Mangrovibacterium sp. TaxID=1961364 RepID=UPI0035681AD7